MISTLLLYSFILVYQAAHFELQVTLKPLHALSATAKSNNMHTYICVWLCIMVSTRQICKLAYLTQRNRYRFHYKVWLHTRSDFAVRCPRAFELTSSVHLPNTVWDMTLNLLTNYIINQIFASKISVVNYLRDFANVFGEYFSPIWSKLLGNVIWFP